MEKTVKRIPKTRNRGLILAAAAITGSCSGAIYMWSIFNTPLIDAYGWTPSEVALPYSLFLLMECLTGFAAGKLQEKVKPQYLVLISGIGFALGWFLSGYATTLPMLYLAFGLIAGGSDGIFYNTTVATAVRWFPDKRGFANGICVSGMGLAPLIYAPLGNFLIESYGISVSFKICGLIFLCLFAAFSLFIDAPEPGWEPEGWVPTEAQKTFNRNDMSTGQMLRQPLFWIVWFSFAMAATSGLMMMGHASSIGQQLAQLTATQGALMVGIVAVASCFGRLILGWLSDRIGRYNMLLIILVVTAADMLFFFSRATDFTLFMVALCIIGFFFGGVMVIMPALCADLFGPRNLGMNYAALYSGYTLASFIGPMLAATVVEHTGTYGLAFTVAGLLSIVGLAFVLIAKRLPPRTVTPSN